MISRSCGDSHGSPTILGKEIEPFMPDLFHLEIAAVLFIDRLLPAPGHCQLQGGHESVLFLDAAVAPSVAALLLIVCFKTKADTLLRSDNMFLRYFCEICAIFALGFCVFYRLGIKKYLQGFYMGNGMIFDDFYI